MRSAIGAADRWLCSVELDDRPTSMALVVRFEGDAVTDLQQPDAGADAAAGCALGN
jgi:hypothetical protein